MTPLAIFGLGVPELLIILAVVLLLFGGARLAGLGKSTGRALREFKEETKDLKAKEGEDPRALDTPQIAPQQPVQQPMQQPAQQPYAQQQPAQQPYAQQQQPYNQPYSPQQPAAEQWQQQPPAGNVQDPSTEVRRDS